MGRVTVLNVLALFAALAVARAEDNPAAEIRGIDEARQALRQGAFPWYDKASDSLKPVHVTPVKQRDEENSQPQNAEGSRESSQSPSANTSGFFFGLGSLSTIVAVVLMVLIFAAITWLIVRAYLLGESSLAIANSGVRQAAVDDAARIEALPFQIRSRDVDLLVEARRLYEEGKYSEAIVYLFSYQLIDMDRHQVIRLSKGKTNRQYLRELRRQPRLRSIVEQSMIAFEEVFFGGRQLGREGFEAVWRQVEQFTVMLAQPEAA